MMQKARGVTWDLTFLYDSFDDERINEDFHQAQMLTDSFIEKYEGKIASDEVTSRLLLQALGDIEKIYSLLIKPFLYGNLSFSENTSNAEAQSLINRAQKEMAEIENKLLFFDKKELLDIPTDIFNKLIASPELDHYKSWLINQRLWKAFTLSDKEEHLINVKNLSGRDALIMMYSELLSSLRFPMAEGGETVEVSAAEIDTFMSSSDRDVRKRAFESRASIYEKNSMMFASIYNALIKDHHYDCKMRGMDDIMTPAYLRDNIPGHIIKMMINTVQDNYPLLQRYYGLKAKMLQLPHLEIYDRTAPVGPMPAFTFEEARTIILDVYRSFDSEFYERTQQFFSEPWIDAEIRPDKRFHGFCARILPELHPVLFLNYSDTMSDMFTLAHELGHGVHYLFAAEKQTFLTYSLPSIIAETASNFSTTILADHLVRESEDKTMKKMCLVAQLEDFFSSVTLQIVFVSMEREAHQRGSEKKLSAAEFSELWQRHISEASGNNLRLEQGLSNGWIGMLYFYTSPFLCYSYAFAQLFVVGLYQSYLENKTVFLSGYKELLRAGGELPPQILAERSGIDLESKDFWNSGFDYISKRLEQLEDLIA
ncbi:M3 family oligoendopeptidase [candidate division CSSED10-310 bacterium]|uniref:M3 family oligoendopeptidase n=1 Tax=candidate division CSSED10-310 bacterium TaxID=2855610 RepID=A0ABV6Z0W2_UNCC1